MAADILYVTTIATVRTQLKAINRKLGVGSIHEAVVTVWRSSVVTQHTEAAS